MSTIPREGQSVSYVGDGRDGRALGERGRLLAVSGHSGHVKWTDATITLVDLDDVAPVRSTATARAEGPDELADSLEVGLPVQAGLHAVFAAEGSSGVLNVLAGAGQLTSFAAIAESTRIFAEQQVRADPTFRAATAALDEDEADELITMATLVLLRDAFSEVDDAQ